MQKACLALEETSRGYAIEKFKKACPEEFKKPRCAYPKPLTLLAKSS